MEEPGALTGPLVQNLIRSLGQAEFLSPASWTCLVDFAMATRFAWLSEWLRSVDPEMVALELDYLELLFCNRVRLMEAWRIDR
jgi:hypothetical protein